MCYPHCGSWVHLAIKLQLVLVHFCLSAINMRINANINKTKKGDQWLQSVSAPASDLWEFEEDVGVELAAILELLLVGGTSAGTMKMVAATKVVLGGIDAGTMRTLAIMIEVELGGIDAGTMKLPASTLEVLMAWVLAP